MSRPWIGAGAPTRSTGMTLGLASLAAACLFAVRSGAPDHSGFGHPFESLAAVLLGAFGLAAVLAAAIAFGTRSRWPVLSAGMGVGGAVCGLVPLGLVVAFVALEALG